MPSNVSALKLILTVVLVLAALNGVQAASPAKPPVSKTAAVLDTTTIPFEYDPILMPYIVVQASINGKPPLPFVVDTGTFNMLLAVEPWAAKKLNLPLVSTRKNQTILGQGGTHTIASALVQSLKVAGRDKSDAGMHYDFRFNGKAEALTTTPFEIVDVLSNLGKVYHVPRLAGIIPCDLLHLFNAACVMQIDFQHKNLVFQRKTAAWKPAAASFAIPLRYDAGKYLLSAVSQGGKPLDFLLDTGNPSTSMQRMAAGPFPNGQSTQIINASSGRKKSYDALLLPQIQMSGLVEPDVPLYETDPGNATSSPNIIGNDFLSRFLITLDFAGNTMYLQRRSDYAPQIVPPGRANVRLEMWGKQHIVAWVKPGSPADLAGVRVADQITAVDGQTLPGVPWYAAQSLLDGREGTAAKLTVLRAGGTETNLSFTRSKKFSGRRHALLGVSLEWVQGNLMVGGTTPGSPLDQTLKFNDDIYYINGLPVAKMTMDEAFDQLERPDLVLQAWRDPTKAWQELHLAPLPLETQVLKGPAPAGNQYRYYERAGWTVIPQ